jgi:hypothetical protein
VDARIVICFRAAPTPGGAGRGFLERARALDTRARVRGATLVGWDGSRVCFSFDAESLPEAVGLATEKGEDTVHGDTPWSVGIAEGPLEPVAPDHGELAWGPALAAASVLAGAARPGEILCAPSVRALAEGALVTSGSRMGRDGALRVRGRRLHVAQPFRKQVVEQLAHMRKAPLVEVPLLREQLAPGSLLVLRADPGAGGTRWLAELAAASPRSLALSPSGSSYEPLGALRRALARTITHDLNPLLIELAEPLESLLSGHGVSLDVAARLVSAFHWRKGSGEALGHVIIDDARSVDPASLEACVRAARVASATFAVVARLDATGGLPSTLAALPKAAEIELGPLSEEAGEALAGGCTGDALDPVARRRWAHLGGNVPLAIVEAVAYGIVTGDLVWTGDKAAPRSRAAGRGKVRTAAEWITLRARDEADEARALLCAVALLGGEVKLSRLAGVLERAGKSVDVDAVVAELMRAGWLVDTQEDWVALPSRTHREALAALLSEGDRKQLHTAAAEVLEDEEGGFGRVEAGWHAAQAGDATRASKILLRAAKAAAEARLDASTTQIIAFARRIDPTCEEGALELLGNALSRPSLPPPRGMSLAPPSSNGRPPPIEIIAPSGASGASVDAGAHDSEPPTLMNLDLPPRADVAPPPPPIPAEALSTTPSEPPSMAGADIASRLGELAKDALLAADNAALERWVDGLRAAGESPLFTERMLAMARLGRGDIGDALRVLRRTRAQVAAEDHKTRCQTSLALGVALSVAGRQQEALLEGLDALARARQAGDTHGANACLAFLAKLYTSVGQTEQAARLRAAQA